MLALKGRVEFRFKSSSPPRVSWRRMSSGKSWHCRAQLLPRSATRPSVLSTNVECPT